MSDDKCLRVKCHDNLTSSCSGVTVVTHQVVSEVGRQLEAVTRGHGESLSGVRGRGRPEVHHALPVAALGPQPRHEGPGAQVHHALLPLAAVKTPALVKTISKLLQNESYLFCTLSCGSFTQMLTCDA